VQDREKRERAELDQTSKHELGLLMGLKGQRSRLLRNYDPTNAREFHTTMIGLLERRDNLYRQLKCKRSREES